MCSARHICMKGFTTTVASAVQRKGVVVVRFTSVGVDLSTEDGKTAAVKLNWDRQRVVIDGRPLFPAPIRRLQNWPRELTWWPSTSRWDGHRCGRTLWRSTIQGVPSCAIKARHENSRGVTLTAGSTRTRGRRLNE